MMDPDSPVMKGATLALDNNLALRAKPYTRSHTSGPTRRHHLR